MEHKDLLRDNIFWVYIDKKKYAFQKIEGIVNQFSKEVYNEGGVEQPHFLAVNQSDINTLVLERGVQMTKEAFDFASKMQPGIILSNVEIIVLDRKKKPCREYYIDTAMVTKYSVSNFDAMSESVLIESLELSYYKMSQMKLN